METAKVLRRRWLKDSELSLNPLIQWSIWLTRTPLCFWEHKTILKHSFIASITEWYFLIHGACAMLKFLQHHSVQRDNNMMGLLNLVSSVFCSLIWLMLPLRIQSQPGTEQSSIRTRTWRPCFWTTTTTTSFWPLSWSKTSERWVCFNHERKFHNFKNRLKKLTFFGKNQSIFERLKLKY